MLLRVRGLEKVSFMSERDRHSGAGEQAKSLHSMHPMRFFSLTQDGHLKSTLLLYSFSYALVLAAVYAAVYFLLLGPLNTLTEGLKPIQLVNLIQSLIPAMTGTVIGIIPQLLMRNKKIVPGAYIMLDILILPIAVTAVITMSAADRPAFVSLMLLVVGLPVLIGTVSSFIIYCKQSGKCFRKQTEGKEHGTQKR